MKKIEKKKITIKKPEIKVERRSLGVFALFSTIFGVIIGFFASAIASDTTTGVIVGVVGGLISGVLTQITGKTLLKDVKYPSLKKLFELVVYTLIICTIISVIILGLDFVFIRLRDIILKA